MSKQCPGMNPSTWKVTDIKEHKCSNCGAILEFWKDDVKRTCSKCGKIVINPNLENLCLSWCEKAAECIGDLEIDEWKKSKKEKIKSKK